jgi:ribonuclease E
VIDFIDMVLESNRELVLRRLLECLGRDRTKHQVAEVTSLGLVQMTRKRVGQGLLEAFSETCDHCNGRGIIVHMDPVDAHGRGNKPSERAAVEHTTAEHAAAMDRVAASRSTAEHGRGAEAADEAEDGGPGTSGAHHAGSAAESRANRRRRRKGKHHDGEDAPGTAVDSAWTLDAPGPGTSVDAAYPAQFEAAEDVVAASAAGSVPAEPPAPIAPINLKAHADDPDSAAASDDLGEALADTGRPRKRRRAASRPAGSPQSAAEAS